MKKLFILTRLTMALTTFCPFTVWCSSKYDLKLHLAIEKAISANNAQQMGVLIKGDVKKIAGFVISHGGGLKYNGKNIVACYLSPPNIVSIAEQHFVSQIATGVKNVIPLNDTMRVKNRIEDCHLGAGSLNMSYKGNGVVLGFIDSGIDFTHPDFKDSVGNSRIKFVWDQSKPIASNTPQPYNYGQEWSNIDIDNGTANNDNATYQFGHGTHVAGIGAGNGRAIGQQAGAAPEADIIMVAYDFNYQGNNTLMADAVDYIFNKASALGKPCVINASLGSYYGSHDGLDLEAELIDDFLDTQAGRIMVTASGNIGGYPIHLKHENTSTNDTSFTWFKYNPAYNAAYVQIFADVTNLNALTYSIGADEVGPTSVSERSATPYRSPLIGIGNIQVDTLKNGSGNRLAVMQSLISNFAPGVLSIEFYIQPDSTNLFYSFKTVGTGLLDSWTTDWVWQNLPSNTIYPFMNHYVLTDTNSNLISSYGCSPKVITVGNYFNTDRHLKYDSTVHVSANDFPNQLAANSSRGPDRYQRIKPDLAATGHHTVSTVILSAVPAMIANNDVRLALGGFHASGGGTSAAAPVVAGIAALYLQACPTATYQDFRNDLFANTYTDGYTWGPYPNNAWGYGKADGIMTLMMCNNAVLGNNDLKNQHLLVVPSLVSSSGEISLTSDLIIKELSIIDLQGKKVFGLANIVNRNTTCGLPPLSEGLYLIQVIFENETMAQSKLVVTSK